MTHEYNQSHLVKTLAAASRTKLMIAICAGHVQTTAALQKEHLAAISIGTFWKYKEPCVCIKQVLTKQATNIVAWSECTLISRAARTSGEQSASGSFGFLRKSLKSMQLICSCSACHWSWQEEHIAYLQCGHSTRITPYSSPCCTYDSFNSGTTKPEPHCITIHNKLEILKIRSWYSALLYSSSNVLVIFKCSESRDMWIMWISFMDTFSTCAMFCIKRKIQVLNFWKQKDFNNYFFQ